MVWNVCIYIHEGYWSVVFFFCNIFVWFCYQGSAGHIKWIGSISFTTFKFSGRIWIKLSFFFFFFFPLFGCTCGIWKFLGQGLNLSLSCNLCQSCGNAWSLTHCAWPRIKPMPPRAKTRSLTHHTSAGTPIIISSLNVW